MKVMKIIKDYEHAMIAHDRRQIKNHSFSVAVMITDYSMSQARQAAVPGHPSQKAADHV